jgi:hypothetical protein
MDSTDNKSAELQRQMRVEALESMLGFDVVQYCVSTNLRVFPYLSSRRIELSLSNNLEPPTPNSGEHRLFDEDQRLGLSRRILACQLPFCSYER